MNIKALLPKARDFSLKALRFLKTVKPLYYVVIALVVAIGVFNAATALNPVIKQKKREANIVRTFDHWWLSEGVNEFERAGIQPTPQLRDEQFESYREKYLQQNPTYIVEDRIEAMKKDYREWWENKGGRENYLQQNNRIPTEADYQECLSEWIDKYTGKFYRYSMAYVPAKGHIEHIFTSWMLFPGVLSYLLFAGFFTFTFIRLSRRWHMYILLGLTAAATFVGPILVGILTSTSFFDHYEAERYMGMSIPVAFLLGAVAFNKRDDASNILKGVCIAGLVVDVLVNWFVNPGIFGAVALLELLGFGLGALAGLKIEPRRKSRFELQAEALQKKMSEPTKNPFAERKARTRALINDGFTSVKNCRPEQAQKELAQALNQLLQEVPLDVGAIVSLAERMTAHENYLEYTSNQWMEWGEIAKVKNVPMAAVPLLKKALSKEKDANFARRALFILGETCVRNNIEPEDGVRRLQKVIEMNEGDILARQARQILTSAGYEAH